MVSSSLTGSEDCIAFDGKEHECAAFWYLRRDGVCGIQNPRASDSWIIPQLASTGCWSTVGSVWHFSELKHGAYLWETLSSKSTYGTILVQKHVASNDCSN